MRPQFHYTPRANWLSDPNGLVHDGARWHMFYQYNPLGQDWGHMAWGHATSEDLAIWREHAPALCETHAEMVFSGSAVVDAAGSAGFGTGALVAIYTSATQGAECRQSQSLAFSTDGGARWHRFAGNPVLDYGLTDFRDPSVFWHTPTARWVMVVAQSAVNAALILTSSDLKTWCETGRIEAGDAPGTLWECPMLVELPLAGTGETRWLFKVDALNDAPGSGAVYCTGAFDGEVFTQDEDGWRVFDHGSDFYAAIPWNGPRDDAGRPAWIGWMGNHAYQHKFPLRGWRGVMSVPRRLQLVERDGMMLAAQLVEPTVLALFRAPEPIGASEVLVPTACRLELAANFVGTLALDSSITLTCTAGEIAITRDGAELPFLACTRTIPRPPAQGLTLLVDSETVELLSADGTISAGFQHRPTSGEIRLRTSQPAAVSVARLIHGAAAKGDSAGQARLVAQSGRNKVIA